MGFQTNVGIKMGYDGTDVTAGLKQTEKSVRDLGEGLGKIGIQGAGFVAIGNAMRAVLDHARNLKGELDENEAAAKRFATAFDGMQESALDAGVQVLGWLNNVAEKGTEGYMRQLNAVGLISDATIRNMEISDMAIANAEKFAAWKEKEGKQHAEINKQLQAAEERRKQALEGELGLSAQIYNKQLEIAAAEAAIAKAGENTVEGKKQRVKLAEAETEITKLLAKEEDEKQKAEKEHIAAVKKADDESKKVLEEILKGTKLKAEEEERLAILLAKQNDARRTLTLEESKELKALELKKQLKENEYELEKLLEKGAQSLTKEELERVRLIEKSNDELNRKVTQLQPQDEEHMARVIEQEKSRLELAKKIADEEERRQNAISASRRISAATIGNFGGSDYELASQISNLKSELQKAKFDSWQQGTEGWSAAEFTLQSNINALEAIREQRRRKADSDAASARYETLKDAGVPNALFIAGNEKLFERWKASQEAANNRLVSTFDFLRNQGIEQKKTDDNQTEVLAQIAANTRTMITQLKSGGLDEFPKYGR